MTPDDLRALRKSKYLTLPQAARLTGTTSYQHYEHGGRYQMDSATGRRILRVLTEYEPPSIEGDDNRARLKRFLRDHGLLLKQFAAWAGINWADASHLHSKADYLPGPTIAGKCAAIGLDLHRSDRRVGSGCQPLTFAEPANCDQARAVVAYQREHGLYQTEFAKRLGITEETLRKVIAGATPRNHHVVRAFAAIGVTWPEPEKNKRPQLEPAPRPKPPVRWSPCGDSEQSRLLDEWMRKHHSPAHAAQTIRIDQATLLRIRRGSKPRCYRVRDKLAAIGVVWPVEAQPADPVASKQTGHCACGAVLTRYRTVVLDGVAMCPACHRRFFGVGVNK